MTQQHVLLHYSTRTTYRTPSIIPSFHHFIMSQNINHYSPTHFISLDIHPSILKRSKEQHFYIIRSVSVFYPNPEPILYLLGSFGNEYKLCFSKDTISCSCDYSNSFPCKHLLFILRSLDVKIKSGPLLVYPYKILQLLTKDSVSHLCLDRKTDDLCSSHRTNGSICCFCKHLLEGPISTCFQCSLSFHYVCVQDKFYCPHCSSPCDFLQSHNINNHRNLYNILSRRIIPLSQQPPYPSLIQQFEFNQDGSMQSI